MIIQCIRVLLKVFFKQALQSRFHSMDIFRFLLLQGLSIVMSFNGLVDSDDWEEEQDLPVVDELKEDDTSRYKDGEYFEGDLAISQELIDAYYGPPQTAVRTQQLTLFKSDKVTKALNREGKNGKRKRL